MEEHINDPSLRGWIMQDFSTTTDNDRIVKAIAMMGTLQKYFEFGCCLGCGLPSVTLLGKREDWAKMLAALDRLPTFGKETAEWAGVLSVVLSRFVATFDEPESERTKDFWQRIAHYSAGDSGPSYWSGWITAFCFWDAEGKSLRDKGRFTENDGMNEAITLTIDEQLFHWVDSDEMPPGYVAVPVTVNDNGAVFVGRMVAGVVGVSVVSSGRELEHGGTGMDTLRPEVGWWMFEDKEAEPEWTPVPELHGT